METASERRRRKLVALCDEHDVSVVAERAKLNPDTLMQVIKGVLLPARRDGKRSARSLGNDAAKKIEDAFGLGRGWFDDAAPLQGGMPIDEAHVMSLSGFDDPPLLNWEDLLNSPLPDRFALRLPDDAMAPRAPAGTLVRFLRTHEARQGDGVLVRDAAGNLYFRRLQQRTPTHWRAVPGNDAFAVLDSIADGLVIVAVLTGIDARWSEAY